MPVKHFKLTFWDCLVVALLVVASWRGSTQVFLLAGIALLLYLLVRSYVLPSSEGTVTETQSVSDDDVFEMGCEGSHDQRIVLDADINNRPCKNHFRSYSRYDTLESELEYEYRIEGTDVFIRLLQDSYQDSADPRKTWDVLDGVVQEIDVRARFEKGVPFPSRDIEKNISDMKEMTDWKKLSSSNWGGFKYFVLAKNLGKADARRFMRQELERLRMGIGLFTKHAMTFGLEPNGKGGVRLAGGRSEGLSDAEFNKFQASAETFGISYAEFVSGDRLAALLQKLVGLQKEQHPDS